MTRWFRRARTTLLAICSVIPFGVWADNSGTLPSAVARGEYLARAANCMSCHTRPDGAPYAGGVAFETPFGTLYSTNITSDREAGIGAWTAEQFRRAMREGIRADGEHLYPAFPYTAFTKLSDADVDAMFAYFKTVPAAPDRSPENELSFPFNQRWLLGVWKALYFDEQRFVPDPVQSQEWNRGAYLVEALGHCGACHTPRNFLGAERTSLALTGGTYLDKIPGGKVRPWSAVNLTSAPSGLGPWSVEELVAYLKTGVNSFATSFGPMNKVIVNSTRYLTDADVHAMAVYLKSLPPLEQSFKPAASEDVLRQGELLYGIHCATCHLPTGLGAAETGPAMAGNPVVQAADPASLVNSILHGPELPHIPLPAQRPHMEAYAVSLSDEEVAALSSYLRNAWGNRGGRVTAKQVAAQR